MRRLAALVFAVGLAGADYRLEAARRTLSSWR